MYLSKPKQVLSGQIVFKGKFRFMDFDDVFFAK